MTAPRRVAPLTRAQMEVLTTPRLLAYRSKLLGLESTPELSDLDPDEVAALQAGYLYWQDDPAWAANRADLTEVLARREHLGGA